MGYRVGQVEFVVEHRQAGLVDEQRDGGATLRVYSDIEGQRTELLRFDCFHIAPHFHYAPAGENKRWFLDPLTTGDTIEWTREQVRNKLPQMLAQAGYQEVADSVDQEAVRKVLPQIEAALRSGSSIL